MKVVLLCPELYVGHGGIARMLQLYRRALVEDVGTTELDVCTLNDPQDTSRHEPGGAGRAPVKGCAAGRSRLRFLRQTLRSSRGARRLICGHVHLLPVARLARWFNPELAVYLVAHGIEIDVPSRPLLRWALHDATGVWCVSEDTRARFLARHPGLPVTRVRVLPNALDPAVDPAPGSPARELAPVVDPVILAVSRLDPREPYKGIELLLRAVALARADEPALRLRIVGDGADRDRLRGVSRALGLDAAVVFTGTLDDNTLRTEYERCRIFALPSTREGFGLVFLEAMAHGKPCVGVRAGAVPELVDSDSGLLAPPDDAPALAAALLAALRRPWEAARIRARAGCFSFSAFRQRLAQAY
jgi:phosphatidylinositol alpha-1,6-mannosyltransferase